VPTPDKGDGRQVKPFAATLQELSGGTVAARLAEQLQELTAAVKETGKKGTLTLQLVVAPLNKGNLDNLVVSAKSVVKPPEDDSATATSVFFTDKDGNLTRDDPKQPTLPCVGWRTGAQPRDRHRPGRRRHRHPRVRCPEAEEAGARASSTPSASATGSTRST
jgi:hypothetical protein